MASGAILVEQPLGCVVESAVNTEEGKKVTAVLQVAVPEGETVALARGMPLAPEGTHRWRRRVGWLLGAALSSRHTRLFLCLSTAFAAPKGQSQTFCICLDLTTVKKENCQNSTSCLFPPGTKDVLLHSKRTKPRFLTRLSPRVRGKPVVSDQILSQRLCDTKKPMCSSRKDSNLQSDLTRDTDAVKH